jgi:hypothetical protein
MVFFMKFGVNDISHLSGLVIGFYQRFGTFSTDSLGHSGMHQTYGEAQSGETNQL